MGKSQLLIGGYGPMAETPKTLTDYSPKNQLAILAQRPDATALAGYRAWQGFGRQVRRGERGIRITAPVTAKTDDGRKMVNVRGAVIFDVSQTDPTCNCPAADVPGEVCACTCHDYGTREAS